MQFAPSETRDYLMALFESVPGFIDIRFIQPDGPTERAVFTSVGEALAAIADREGQAINIHPCPVTRRTGGTSEGEGGKGNLSQVKAAWADLDIKEPDDFPLILRAIEEFPRPPSIVIESGGGIHLYWIFEEPIDLAVGQVAYDFEHMLIGIADVLGGDLSVTQVAAAMRAPGTINYPDAKKRERGRTPAMCRLRSHDGHIYSVSQFEEFALRGRAVGRKKVRKVEYERATFDETCPEKVQALLDAKGPNGNPRHPKLLARWGGDMSDLGGNQSASELDMSIACLLAILNVEPGDIENALRFRRARDGDKEKHSGYYELTVSKALAAAAERKDGSDDRDTERAPEFNPFQPLVNRYGPDFPTELLPEVLRDMVVSLTEAVQLSTAITGVVALGMTAIAVAKKLEAMPRPGWKEPLNLYVVGILPSANRKSSLLRELRKPIDDFESNWNATHRDEIEQSKVRIKVNEKRVKKLEDKHSSENDPVAREKIWKELDDALNELKIARHESVYPIRLTASDITPEAAVELMARNGERIGLITAEGDEFFGLMSRYSSNNTFNLDFYLKAHAGDPHTVDRKTSLPIQLKAPAMTAVLLAQPLIVEKIRSNPEMRQKGLIARFVFAVPESWLGKRKIAPNQVPESVRDRYAACLNGLLKLEGDRISLRFTPEADTLLRAFEDKVEPMLGEGGELESMSDWAGKLAGLAVRIAGILHCVEMYTSAKSDRSWKEKIRNTAGFVDSKVQAGVWGFKARSEPEKEAMAPEIETIAWSPANQPIGPESVRRAIGIAEWALVHAQCALSGSREGDPEALRVWRGIRGHRQGEEVFSARDAFGWVRSQDPNDPFYHVGATKKGLKALVGRGYLREIQSSGDEKKGGRPASPRYAVTGEALASLRGGD